MEVTKRQRSVVAVMNIYFAFGVPAGCLVLYFLIALYRKRSQINYLGFVLFIIAGFLTAFSFQIIQYGWQLSKTVPLAEIQKENGYDFHLLYLPLAIGLLLVIVNIYRGYRRISKIKHIS